MSGEPELDSPASRTRGVKTVGIVLLSLVVGAVLRPALERGVEIFTERTLSIQKLSYELESVSRHSRNELTKIAKEYGVAEFDLRLDDPILTDYYLIKVRLRSVGQAIKSTLKFAVTIKNGMTKLLDIQHRVIRPANKSLRIVDSLPPLKWQLPTGEVKSVIVWDYEEGVEGYNIYRSFCEKVGYGRINDQPIESPRFELPRDYSKDLVTCYYVVTAGEAGVWESDWCHPMKEPDVSAFCAYFENVHWVKPYLTSEVESDRSRKPIFSSLSKAIKAVGKSGNFIVAQTRDEAVTSKNVSSDVTVFYKNDLEFLDGNVELSVLNGFDKNADIELFFLCKAVPTEKESEFAMVLEGSPEIDFEESQRSSYKSITFPVPKTGRRDNIKETLTPKQLQTYPGKNTIYLAWEKPENPSYKGVRIFRSELRDLRDITAIGEQIYDGEGSTMSLQCKHVRGLTEPTLTRERISANVRVELFCPPPRIIQKDCLPPLSPSGLSMERLFDIVDVDMRYFTDRTVSPHTSYTYTLFAYDDSDRYSYPIIINTSLDYWSPKTICCPKQAEPVSRNSSDHNEEG